MTKTYLSILFLSFWATAVTANSLPVVDVTVTVTPAPESRVFYWLSAESSDQKLARSVERRLGGQVLDTLCPSANLDCVGSLPEAKGIKIRQFFNEEEISKSARAEVQSCYMNWRKTVPADSWGPLEEAIGNSPLSAAQLQEVTNYGRRFAAFVAEHHGVCESSDDRKIVAVGMPWESYWKLRKTGKLSFLDREELIPAYRALFDDAVDRRVKEKHEIGGAAFQARLAKELTVAATFGWAEDERIDPGSVFEAVARGDVHSPAQLALAAFAAIPSSSPAATAKHWTAPEMRPAIWFADVLLSRCRLANSRPESQINPACGQTPENFFVWVNLKIDGRAALILWPRVFTGETEDSFTPNAYYALKGSQK